MNTIPEDQWIAEVARLLCESQRAENDGERANCHEWAAAIYDSLLEACDGDHTEIDSPKEAHDYELSCG